MKILVVNNLYPPNAVGGYERLVALVASELARRGHDVSVLTSGHGGRAAGPEELRVDRSLELLVSRHSIYEPFDGTAADREAICARNRAAIARCLDAAAPDVVLAGNLYFLDRDVLDAFRPVAARMVSLLTDVWAIHFADDEFLQDFFRRTVFAPDPRVPPLVAADPPRLVLEDVTDAESWARRAASLSPELARRRRLEVELARGRRVFQVPGICHVCGRTSFVVRGGEGQGPRAAASEGAIQCGRCGLDAPVRVALHALDLLAAPPTDDGVLLAISDAGARAFLARHFPRATVVASLDEAAGRGTFRHVAAVGERGDDALARACAVLAPGGRAVVHAAGGPEGVTRGAPAGARASALGMIQRAGEAVADAAAYDVWSLGYGYLVPGEVLCSGRARSAA